MHRSIVFATDALQSLYPVARAAEAAGFHRLWTTEYTTRDALLRAVALANETATIEVATGIAYAFTRAPLAMAASVADAYILTGGRLSLGLGAGTRGMRKYWYGVEDFDHPAPRLSEYIELMRAAWRADAGLEFSGRFYDAKIPVYRSTHGAEALQDLRVYGSGLNRIMLREAAASCDGVALHPLASAYHYMDAVVMPAYEEGIIRGGESPTSLAVWKITSIDDDEAVARDRARMNLAFYYSTPSYGGTAEGTSWEPAAAAVRDGFRAMGSDVDWAELAGQVTDEMIDDLVLCGTPAQVRDRLVVIEEEMKRRGVNEVVFQTVGVGLEDHEVVANCQRIVDTCGPSAAA